MSFRYLSRGPGVTKLGTFVMGVLSRQDTLYESVQMLFYCTLTSHVMTTKPC